MRNLNFNHAEKRRLEAMSVHENRLKERGFKAIAGVDEAGRGPLAGPVVAAAVILPEGALFENLNDSKKLSPEERGRLYDDIVHCEGIKYGIGIIDGEIIDKINILQATFKAMKEAIGNLPIKPDFLLIDGNQLPFVTANALAIVEGDALSVSIAAASILAKVTRDRIMEKLDETFPEYGFKQHKGYATEQHLKAIEKWGPCAMHRKSFDPIRSKYYGPVQTQMF